MKNELTLCPKCLSNFAAKPNTTVYRVDYLQINKETCCFCQARLGYDYVIKENSQVCESMNRTFARKNRV